MTVSEFSPDPLDEACPVPHGGFSCWGGSVPVDHAVVEPRKHGNAAVSVLADEGDVWRPTVDVAQNDQRSQVDLVGDQVGQTFLLVLANGFEP